MFYLLLRALALVFVLAEIMRNVAGMKMFNRGRFLTVLIEVGDLGKRLLGRIFWRAVIQNIRKVQ